MAKLNHSPCTRAISAMRFGKNVLSQNLRTECDLALYLSLHKDRDLARLGLPVPLEARPGVGTLRDAGFEQEAIILARLDRGLRDRLVGERGTASTGWREQDLKGPLNGSRTPPFVLVQPRYEIGPIRDATLRRLGVTRSGLGLMPLFEAMVPDLIVVEGSNAEMFALSTTGERRQIERGDTRLSLSVVDIKHAQQANPSYEAEVVLYGLMLANWLVEHELAQRYFVNASLYLWTGAGVASATLQRTLDKGERSPEAIIAAARKELTSVNVPIYVQAIRRFFSDRLPTIVRQGIEDWRQLDWYVGPACASCDWLGYEGWLSAADHRKVAENPDQYCFSRAQRVDHLSRLSIGTRGACRVMARHGYDTVAAIARTTDDAEIYGKHTTLRAHRRLIPAVARAIVTSTSTTDPKRSDGMLARYADLDIFVSVNFDPGAGLLTGIGVQAHFRQPAPYGISKTDRLRRQWREKWIVSAKSAEGEGGAVLGFLQLVADIFDFVEDTQPHRGGPHADQTRTQFVFWDHRQFEELCLGMGRHLPAVLYDPQQERYVKALTWVFPPEEIQETDQIDSRRPCVAFVRDVVRRLVRVPALHTLTLFNVADHYHYGSEPLQRPDQFYREPLSDMIPRERIYEVWQVAARGGTGTIRWGRVLKTFNQLTEGVGRTIDQQGRALSSITWRLRGDFGNRLTAEAPRVRLIVPTWARNVANDSKLWIAWQKFETACGRASAHRRFLADPDEIEAAYEGLRLQRRVEQRPDGAWVFSVSPDSLNTKLRDSDGFLCLSVNSIPGFPALTANRVLAPTALPHEIPVWLGRTPMHKLFPVTLEALDRVGGTAVVRVNELYGPAADDLHRLREIVSAHLGELLHGDITLIPSLGGDIHGRRLERILRAVGNPPNARAAPEARSALGIVRTRRPFREDLVTPISRVLWEGAALSEARLRPEGEADRIAERAQARAGLNSSQASAVRQAAGHALTIIWGPPGTGKTRTCSALLHSMVVEEASAERGRAYGVLVTGPTYKAVNETVGKLSAALAADPAAACTLYLIHSRYRDDRFATPDGCHDHLHIVQTFAEATEPGFQSLVEDINSASHVIIVAAVVHQCPKIAEALAKIDGGSDALRPLFDLVVIDESSQVDMTAGVGPLALLKSASQLVVVGDHLQMPPIVVTDPPVGAEHLVGSLQTYLRSRFQIEPMPLLENYRSNRDIVSYTRGLGYPRALTAANPETRIRLLRPVGKHSNHLRMVDAAGSDLWAAVLDPSKPVVAITYPDGMAGQANEFEAECVAALAYLLRTTGSRALDGQPGQPEHSSWNDESFWTRGLGVVTPHRAQRAQTVQTLRRIMPGIDPRLIDGAVDTVERFQGSERHTIIISFGVGDPDVIRGEERFLMQLERTNVAISRAMGKCIVLMSDDVADHIPEDRRAAETAYALRGVVDEWCTTRVAGAVMTPDGERSVTVRYRG